MGGIQSLPNFKLNFSSSCCNGEKRDKVDGNNLAQSRARGRFWRTVQAIKGKREQGKADEIMVKEADGIYIESSPTDKVPDQEI